LFHVLSSLFLVTQAFLNGIWLVLDLFQQGLDFVPAPASVERGALLRYQRVLGVCILTYFSGNGGSKFSKKGKNR
jgi:hypothetical protein